MAVPAHLLQLLFVPAPERPCKGHQALPEPRALAALGWQTTGSLCEATRSGGRSFDIERLESAAKTAQSTGGRIPNLHMPNNKSIS
jgi:hypothetical protein